MKIAAFDQPKTGIMELQTPFTKEDQLNANIFRQLFLIQIELERHSEEQTDLANEVRNLIQTIDRVFELAIENGP